MKTIFTTGFLLLLFLHPGMSAASGFRLKSLTGIIDVVPFKTYNYVSFDLEKPSLFSLVSPVQVNSVEIEPKKYRIPFKKKGNNIEFRLERPCKVMIRLNDTLKVFIFAEKPEQKPVGRQVVDFVKHYHPDTNGKIIETLKIQQALNEISGTGKILYFPPGLYKSGQLKIRSNSNIHLARGAEIMADTSSVVPYTSEDDLKTRRFIYIGNAVNVTLSGYGSINGCGTVMRRKFGDDARMRLILASGSYNLRIEGLMLKDPGSWNTHIICCGDVTLTGLKILNDPGLSNTDGFDPDAVRRLLIENCFACCGDDNVAVKTTGNSGLPDDVDGVTVKGCVFLTKKSALKVGTETMSRSMKNIEFTDNDVLECDRGISVYVYDGADLDSISFINNRFMRNYPDLQRKAIHIVVNRRTKESRLGTINHLLISGCRFENQFPRKSVILYDGEGTGIQAEIENLVIGGKKAGPAGQEFIEIKNSRVVFR